MGLYCVIDSGPFFSKDKCDVCVVQAFEHTSRC